MDRKKLFNLINEKLDGALFDYYDALERESGCVYGGDISPLQLFHWDKLVDEFADLFEQLAEQNKRI